MNKRLNSCNKLELRLYRLLRVKRFRKVILWFEKTKHSKDNLKNENYHPSGFDVFSLERYNGFLLYNTSLHIVSLLFTAAYALLSIAIEFRNAVVDLSMMLLTLFNVYCILLQRTNYLRLKEHRLKYYNRIFKQTDLCREERIQQIYEQKPEELLADYEVLFRIKKAFDGQADCVLADADAESLKRICACFEYMPINKVGRKNKEALDAGLIEKCNSTVGPYTALQIRVDWLQRKLRTSGRKMLDCTAIITADAECEKAYRELFHEDSVYSFCLVCFLLYEAFNGVIGKVMTNEA